MRGDGWGLFALVLAEPSITLNDEVLHLAQNDTYTLTAQTVPAGLTPTWTSSAPSNATVDQNGVVTLLRASAIPTTVTATLSVEGYADVTDTCEVYGHSSSWTPSLTLDQNALTVAEEGTAQLTATFDPQSTVRVTWAVDDAETASFVQLTPTTVGRETVEITGLAEGTTNITASMTVNGVPYQATCSITVTP